MHDNVEKITIPYIIGDGIGNDIWKGTHRVLEHAIRLAYSGTRMVEWLEIAAGEKAFQETREYLPAESIAALKQYKVAIKGPLTTPVGGGYTSLNVTLRKELDLYSCVRPVTWFPGLPSPLKNPENVNVIVFRENTEDLYAGIEFPAESEGNAVLLNLLKKEFPAEYTRLRYQQEVGIDLKPISKNASRRIMQAAIRWSIENKRKKISIIHKGNIMKYTEGAFRNWAYEVAEVDFQHICYSKRTWKKTADENGKEKADLEKASALEHGKIFVDDLIADNAFARAIANPADFDVVVTPNLNGDYLSDTFAALVGGIGVSPGANINYEQGWGLFEANHGSAEDIAGLDKANPSSLILSGAMMFDFLGWHEVAALMRKGVEKTIQSGNVTFDLHAQLPGSTLASTSQFCTLVMENMK
jgi:isocitrate dehydrogenase